MMDVKIHKNSNNQLLSIKGVGYNYQSKQYILKLLNKLTQSAGNVIIQVRRNNYKDSSINKIILDFDSLGISNLKVDKNLFEISFSFNSNKLNDELLQALVDFWFCFEQPSYYFLTNLEELILNQEILLNINLSWKEAVKVSNSYVMFKGIEEDVIWIGKSNKLEFDIFL